MASHSEKLNPHQYSCNNLKFCVEAFSDNQQMITFTRQQHKLCNYWLTQSMLYTIRTNQRKPIEIPSCSTIQKDNVCHSFFIYVTKWLQIVVEYDSSRQQLMYDDPVLHRSSPCASTWQHKSVQFPYLTSLQMQPPLHSMHVW